MRFTKTGKVILIVLTMLICMTVGLYVGISGAREFKELTNTIRRYIVIGRRAYEKTQTTDDVYSRRIIGQQSGGGTQNVNSSVELETALLPLTVKKYKIAENPRIPVGGGAIVLIDGKILFMDRLGEFYFEATEGKINKFDLQSIPNNLQQYINNSTNTDLNVNTLRTHSLVYDSANRKLYSCFERYISSQINRLAVAEIDLNPNLSGTEKGWRIIFESTDLDPVKNLGIAGGGKILLNGPELLLSIGDFADTDVHFHANSYPPQDTTSQFGKIFRININSSKFEMVSYGHRNTQGLALIKNNILLNVEQGPQGGDEINIIQNGKNYGWPFQTYGTHYGTYTWPLSNLESTIKWEIPLFAFVPSVAASSILQIEKFHSRWNDDLLVGSLKGKSLYRLKYSNGRIIYSEPIWLGHRVRDLLQQDDTIYVLTDDSLLLKLSVNKEKLYANLRSSDLPPSSSLENCLKCHNFAATTPNSFAPSLRKIIGKRVASDDFDRYSNSIKEKDFKWNEKLLYEFILNPQTVIPGTTMPTLTLSASEAKSLVNELKQR